MSGLMPTMDAITKDMNQVTVADREISEGYT